MADDEAALDAARDHLRAGRVAVAAAELDGLLKRDSTNADALHLRGLAADAAGDPATAEPLIRRALAVRQSPRMLNNLGMVLNHLGRNAEAAGVIRQALALRPAYPEALTNLGAVLLDLSRFAEAEQALREALRLQPGYALAWNNLGSVLRGLGRRDEAIAAHELAVRHNPATSRLGLGLALRESGRYDEAEAAFRRAADDSTGQPDAQIHLALSLQQLGRLEEAATACCMILAERADDAAALATLGGIQQEMGRLAEAEQSYRAALELRPNDVAAHNNLAIALYAQDRAEDALAALDRAGALEPDDPETHHHRAMLLLREGRFAEGWVEYEWRARIRQAGDSYRQFDGQPHWEGQPLEGRTILLVPEQGLGDTIQFVRYARLVAARGGRVILGAPRELAQLMETLHTDISIVPVGDKLPHYDVHCRLMSLPRLFGTDAANMPDTTPYLSPSPAAVTRWRNRLRPDRPGLRVGLVWAGNPIHPGDRQRSVPFSLLAPLLEVPGVRWFSLQVGGRRADVPAEGIEDLADDLTDFSETAAAIAMLDLVIAVDTSTAHLAGATGRPVWVLLPQIADWRWLRSGDTSPWYPGMRLFRQSTHGDWPAVIAAVAAALRNRVAAAQRGARCVIDWTVASNESWGLFGRNILLAWANRQDVSAVWHRPGDSALLELDPLERLLLATASKLGARTARRLVFHAFDSELRPRGADLAPMAGERAIAFLRSDRIIAAAPAGEALRHYDIVVTFSSWNLAMLRDVGVNNGWRLQWGVDVTRFHPMPRRGVFPGRFVIYAGGTMDHRHGADLVLAAFRVFAQSHGDALLLANWRAPHGTTLDGLATQHDIPPDCIVNIAPVAYDTLGRILAEVDAALFPSRAEPDSNPQAMACIACAVPTIVSANTGHLDLIAEAPCYPLTSQAELPGEAFAGWGESRIDEILAALETIYACRTTARSRVQRGADLMAHRDWKTQLDRFGDILLALSD